MSIITLGRKRVSVVLAEEKGLTVTELLTAVSILGILLSMSAVGISTVAQQFDLDNGARQVAMILSQARIQAITRGHRVVVSFGDEEATVTDDTNHEEIATKSFPPHISVSANKDAAFTSIGTITDPDVVIITSNEHGSRDLRIGLIGEVQIE